MNEELEESDSITIRNRGFVFRELDLFNCTECFHFELDRVCSGRRWAVYHTADSDIDHEYLVRECH